jgi:5-methylthioadenosine/S-adenosylhomocysteine deaminase
MPSPIQSADFLIAPRWLMPIAPVNVALEGQAVAVKNGRILAVGPVSQLEAEFQAREHISRPAHVLLPGFVNAHTRASMRLLRGLPVYSPVMQWTQKTVVPAELRSASPDFVHEGTRLAIAEMLGAGITTFADSALFPDQAARAAAAARVRAVIGLPVSESASAWAPDASAYFDRAERIWDEYRQDPWVSLYFALPAGYAIGDSILGRLRRIADELDARIAMPLHETEVEVQDSASQHGLRPLHRLAKLGLLRPGFSAIHMNRLDLVDIDIARDTGISVIACPRSNLRLGSGSCPVPALLAESIPVGFGTDSPIASGAFDLLEEARLAMLLNTEEHSALTAEKALAAATLGGAAALGLGSVCGSIEVGKAADLICVDLDSLPCQSFGSVAENVIFGATRRQVSDVWTGGQPAVRDGRLLAFDEQEMLALSRQYSERISSGASS